ncbi:Glycosyl transferases group 1 [Noviherbaspirillum humi]|uniref:Glycosyl transferases group 1 n=1 Tax=Noviherbaspirillum humi TaxID=1688639 RepID=A0A239K1E1_9BURK|nr:glycosyltransferase [Noviherbaspirillum humi]SNT11845.1 Glycosyl transferases group 1 [Noviherbaspirillum humi]
MLDLILVTSEYPGITKSGGIGAAVEEAATMLQQSGVKVEVLVVVANNNAMLPTWKAKTGQGCVVNLVCADSFYNGAASNEAYSYASFQYLKSQAVARIIFPDYAGLGFYSMNAKRQGLAFADTNLDIAVHGPTAWALSLNTQPYPHVDALTTDFMERQSIEMADTVLYLSQYMRNWVEREFGVAPTKSAELMPNLMRGISASGTATQVGKLIGVQKIIFFGRHEPRKNLPLFVDALALAAKSYDLPRTVEFVFLGDFAEIDGTPSELYILRKLEGLNLKLVFLPGLGRAEAERYLTNTPATAVVVPSVENCPYTVLETIAKGLPVYVCAEGGSKELIAPEFHLTNTFDNNKSALAQCLYTVIKEGARVPAFSDSVGNALQSWVRHVNSPQQQRPLARCTAPLVSLIVVTHNRPEKAIEALNSCLRQSYAKTEVILVDDGSDRNNPQYQELKDFCHDNGVVLVEQENRYLGAARNTGVAKATGKYVLFLDDDDLLLKDAVGRLVNAIQCSGVDILTTLSCFMDASQRGLAHLDQLNLGKVGYLPTGGPLEAGLLKNCFGPSVSLISRAVFTKGVRYTETYGVGHEDYEFYINAVQKGFALAVHPVPAFYYEVGVPSMISQTPIWKNFMRTYGAFDRGAAGRGALNVAGILLGQQVNRHINHGKNVYTSLPEPLNQLYPKVGALDAETRLKMLYKYGEHFKLESTKRVAAWSLRERHEAKKLSAAASPLGTIPVAPVKRKMSAYVNKLHLVKGRERKECIDQIIASLKDLCTDATVPLTNVDYLFNALAVSRSASLASAVVDHSDQLSSRLKDERRMLALSATAHYLLENRVEFKQKFQLLLDGEANDFRGKDSKYVDHSAIEVFKAVTADPGVPSWAFQFTRVTGACLSKGQTGNRDAIMMLHDFINQ